MSDSLTLGEYVRRLRRRAKKSLQDLTDETGISVSHLSRIENDSNLPSVDLVVRLAHALEGDMDFMLERADCLPQEILSRLTRRAAQGGQVMRRAAGSAEKDNFAAALVDDIDPQLRAALAERFNVPKEDAESLFKALEQISLMTEQQRETFIDAIALLAKGTVA